jgi:hypothetical protein
MLNWQLSKPNNGATGFVSPVVTVGTGLTALAELGVESMWTVGAYVQNTGATAFNAFELACKMHPSDVDWTILANAAGNFSTPVFPLRRTVGAPVTLAGGARSALFLDVHYMAIVRVRASVASGTTTAILRTLGK